MVSLPRASTVTSRFSYKFIGGGRTEEKSTLKPAQAAFESGSEGSGETEISPDVREAVLETAGLGGAPPIQAVTRDGKDKVQAPVLVC